MNLVGLNGTNYDLSSPPIKVGGEGSIYSIDDNSGVVAKIFHQAILDQELERKIRTMYRNPPDQNVLNQIAWPIDVLYNSQKQFSGFIMRKLNTSHVLWELFKYPPTELKGVTLQHKLIIAQNICLVISAVHRAGYVFGDFNPMNIGVNIMDGTVAFFDTDTYHFKDSRTGHMYRCKVGYPGYAAPELIATCKQFSAAHPEIRETYAHAPLPTFTVKTDNFALAIHIFRLLMNGYTPYNGIPEAASPSSVSPGIGDIAVERNNYCFAPGNKPMSAATPELTSLPQEVQALFTRAFGTGYATPSARPSSDEWMNALASFEQELKRCNKDSNHLYYKGLSICPYCAADARYLVALNSLQVKHKEKSNSTNSSPTLGENIDKETIDLDNIHSSNIIRVIDDSWM